MEDEKHNDEEEDDNEEEVREDFFGFVDENFWICRRNYLDLSPKFFVFVAEIFVFVAKIFGICRQKFLGFVNNFVLDLSTILYWIS